MDDMNTGNGNDGNGNEPDQLGREDLRSQNAIVRQDFAGTALAHEGPATQALVAKEIATVQARSIMAMRFPRRINDVRALALKSCESIGFAEKAIFKIPRAGKTITGLTIRAAEMLLRAMRNMGAEAITIFDSDEERLVRVIVTDYEANGHWSTDLTIRKEVERRQIGKNQRFIAQRENSFGDTVYIVRATNDDMAMLQGSMVSKASRTGILRLVPAEITAEVFTKCFALQEDKARKDPDGEKKKVFDGFATINILPSQLEEWLGHPVEQLSPGELVELRQLFVALSDGDMTWRDAMDTAEDARERAKEQTKRMREAAKKPAQTGAAQPASTQTTTTTQATQAKAQPKTDAPKADAKSGKGTAAVKQQIADAKKDTASSTQATAAPPASTTAPQPELPIAASTSQPKPTKAGETEFDMKDCEVCGAEVPVEKGYAGPAVKCGDCSSSARDGE